MRLSSLIQSKNVFMNSIINIFMNIFFCIMIFTVLATPFVFGEDAASISIPTTTPIAVPATMTAINITASTATKTTSIAIPAPETAIMPAATIATGGSATILPAAPLPAASSPTPFSGGEGSSVALDSTKTVISDPAFPVMPAVFPTTPMPIETTTGYRGFRYAKWECYDGKSEMQGCEGSCKPSELWQQYAREACAGHCYADNSKCGVNSYSVSIECGDATVANPTVPATNMPNIPVAVPAPNPDSSAAFVNEVEVCYKKLKQENPNEKEDNLWTKCKIMLQPQPAVPVITPQPTTSTPASSALATTTPTTGLTQQCEFASEQLMNELNNAVQKYDIIKKEGRSEQETKEIQDYISRIKEKIKYKKNNCWNTAAQVASTSARPECEIVNDNLKKELEEGYMKTAIAQKEGNEERINDINAYMAQLKNKVQKNRESCWNTKTTDGKTNVVAATSVAVSASWIEAETKPSDVATYYQTKMDGILTEEKTIDSQIMQLKDLKNKIDAMIEELIKKKEIIGADEFNGLVEEFKVSSTEISADDMKFDSVNKEFVKNIGDKSVSIKQGADNVVLTVDNVEVNASASEFAITDKIKEEDIELKALPDKIKGHTKGDIKAVEILKEKDKLVYTVKTEEERKLLGIITVTAEKTTILDASSENADLIKEEKPWWYGISGEVKK